MPTTNREPGLIQNLRDRWRRRTRGRSDGDRELDRERSTELARRSDVAPESYDPLRMLREMMRWDPYRAGAALMPQLERDLWMPHFEVRANGSAIRFIVDVPGVSREDLEVELVGNRLVVSGRRESERRSDDESIHTDERQFGRFTRSFALPDQVDRDRITSDLRDGVLTIVVPLAAGTRGRKIQVGSTSRS